MEMQMNEEDQRGGNYHGMHATPTAAKKDPSEVQLEVRKGNDLKIEVKKRRMSFVGNVIYKLGEANKAHENVITAILWFQKCPNRASLEEIFRKRLLKFERFHSVIKNREGKDYWEKVSHVDLKQHIKDIHLKEPRDNKSIEDFISREYGEYMDYSIPLWRCYVAGLKDDQTALIFRIHHSIGDGTTLVSVLFSLMEERDQTSSQVIKRKTKQKNLCSTISTPMLFFRRLWIWIIGFIGGILLSLTLPDKRTSLKLKNCQARSPHTKVCFGKPVSLQMIKNIKDSIDGTVNDVIVAALNGACIQYLRENSYEENAKKMKKKIRGIFPCNMRVGEVDIHDSKQFGNHFTMVPIDFPLHYTDPMTMLRESKERCNVMKISPYAATVLSLNQLAMKVMSRRFYIDFTRLMFDKFTFLFTNVPGPQNVVELAGQPVQDIRFFVPAMLGCSFSILSYNQQLSFGVLCDPNVVSHPERLTQALYDQFQALYAAATTSTAVQT